MPRPLKELLKDIIGEKAASVVGAFDLIGDIAVIRIPEDLREHSEIIGEALMKFNKNVKSVWAQIGPVEGDYRVRELVHIAGEKRSQTLYKENGCVFKVDVTKVFFTPRLSQERKRIADLVADNEIVFNMFAGVGTFSIVIAKKREAIVHSSEINPYAYDYMVENIKLNKLKGQVVPYLKDAADVSEQLKDKVDRVLMPLPEKAVEYFEYAVKALKQHGFVHVYLHISYPKGSNEKDALIKGIELIPSGKVIYSRVVREVGPRTVQVVYDVEIRKNL
ncbi:MAG: class I SAM-dependent methyltransferase [Nitrososphaeria archaeon]